MLCSREIGLQCYPNRYSPYVGLRIVRRKARKRKRERKKWGNGKKETVSQ